MIPDMGPHATFIWTAYGLAASVIAALIVWLIADGRKQAHLLSALERRSTK